MFTAQTQTYPPEVILLAYVPVPKDLTKVKSKFLFGLTKRQVVCFGIGALVGVPVFFLTKGALGTSIAAMLMIIIMLPFFLFAMFERHGQPLEVILKQFIETRFLRPRTRIYETDNFYAAIDRSVRLKKEVHNIIHGKQRKQTQADASGKAAAERADGTEPENR